MELDTSKEMSEEVWIATGAETGFWQKIVYENMLEYCVTCKLHGHTINNCRKHKHRQKEERRIWEAHDEHGLPIAKPHTLALEARVELIIPTVNPQVTAPKAKQNDVKSLSLPNKDQTLHADNKETVLYERASKPVNNASPKDALDKMGEGPTSKGTNSLEIDLKDTSNTIIDLEAKRDSYLQTETHIPYACLPEDSIPLSKTQGNHSLASLTLSLSPSLESSLLLYKVLDCRSEAEELKEIEMADVDLQQSQQLGEDVENEIITENDTLFHAEPPKDGDGPPKTSSETIVLHEKVKKQIIKEGQGQVPSKYSTCFLHYRAWTQSTQHKFEDTWNEQQPVELIIGKEKKEMTGLGIGLASMKSGERALIHVGWELGYGEEGNFSFPNVPPKADILYEVELLGFDETKEGKARGDMTVEERIGAADRRKMDGNALFKEEKLEEAMNQYEMAIAYMGDDFMFQLFGKYRDMALAVKNPCHLNMAACLIKLKRFNEAIGHCSIVLAEDEDNAKALFRRGKAKSELGQTDAAREDFLKARKYAPEDKAIAKELRILAEQDKAVYQKQKEIYKGLFGPRPEPKPKQSNRMVLFWHWLLALFSRLLKLKRNKQSQKTD
ncbi:hypothetical protein QQ045_003643 [Rhodiola kirilowii]